MDDGTRNRTPREEALVLAEAIRSLRNQRHMTQQDAADALGVTRAAWQNYETGRLIILRSDMQDRIATALGVSREDLLLEKTRLAPSGKRHARPVTGFSERETTYDADRVQAVFPTSQGHVILSYPADLNADGLEQLNEYLTIWMKTIAARSAN